MKDNVNFYKYHGLGNDYIVIKQADLDASLTKDEIVRICHRNYGVGSDGIVLLENIAEKKFMVRVLNPDGSEAETSGNGMRIICRFLYDTGFVENELFTILVKGEKEVKGQILDPLTSIKVDMGIAKFSSSIVPVTGPEREVLLERVEMLGEQLEYSCANVGNPHCVIFGREDLKEAVLKFGPILETHQRFPNRINVQFAKVIDRNNIRIQIWERGAGYTLASGSSSSAVASIAHRLGYVDSEVTIHMPGGKLTISIGNNYEIQIIGSVTKVAEGIFKKEMFL